MDIDGVGGVATVRVERVDPLVLACAACGWVPPGSWPADPTSRLLWTLIDHWWVAHRPERARRPAAIRPAIRVDREDPLIVSCGWCGDVTQLCGDGDLLPWTVIEHWLAVHWDRAGLDDGDTPP